MLTTLVTPPVLKLTLQRKQSALGSRQ